MNRFDGSDSCPTKICITPSKTSAAMVIVCNCLRPLKKPEREDSAFTLTLSRTSEAIMAELEVDAQDVVRLMLQFCKENGLKDSLKALQQESQVLLI